jgi:hypothetical protein
MKEEIVPVEGEAPAELEVIKEKKAEPEEGKEPEGKEKEGKEKK